MKQKISKILVPIDGSTNSFKALHEAFLGSVANIVVHKSKVPVLIVK